MKILFGGYHNPKFMTITEYIEKAIVELGNELISFDDRQFIIPGRIRKKVGMLQDWDLFRLNKKLVKLAEKTKSDIFIETGGHRILPWAIESLKNRGITTVLWTIDAPINFEPIKKYAPYYDYLFCGGSEACELLEPLKIINLSWLPFACAPDYHYKVKLSKKEMKKYGSDISFVGAYYPNRADLFMNLLEYDLSVWGLAWGNAPKLLKPRIKASRAIKYDEWRKIYSASKIIVVAHYHDGKIPCYQVSPKVYEILACKGFLLVDAQPDVLKSFRDGAHLVVYKDKDDLKRKIDYYLQHPEERMRIAEAGYKEVIAKHTYKHRVEKLLESL